MGIKFDSFKYKGVDLSVFNGAVNWDILAGKGIQFAGIRGGYGNVTDGQFSNNWTKSKGKVVRFMYWYLDYYSNHTVGSPVYGMSDVDWGKKQAQNAYNLIKLDNDKTPVFLDIENAGSYAPKITEVTSRVQTIARAFLEELDRLTGIKNAIYAALGMLSWYGTWFRDRILWVAWYTDAQTPQGVLNNVKYYGWSGECLIWQYASNGDVDENGTGDGVAYGTTVSNMDLNGWIASDARWAQFSSGAGTVTPPPTPTPTPVPFILFQIKIIVNSLNIRSQPNTYSTVMGVATLGQIYNVYEQSGSWMKVGDGKWVYGISTYVQKVTSPIPPTPVPNPSGTKYIVTTQYGLNIRASATVSSAIIGFLKLNDVVYISTISNNWGKLANRAGYVSMSYLKVA